jgi:glucosamine-6-phosphate deaminase
MAGLDLISTIQGSLLKDFFPRGWDLARIDACCDHKPEEISQRKPWWHVEFAPIPCDSLKDLEVKLGHEIAFEIRRAREVSQELILILPVGPMGMYRWTVYFLKEWGISCSHVHGFNMDEWSDSAGNTLSPETPGSFEGAMAQAFYDPLGNLTVPKEQRHFATRDSLPGYPKLIADLQSRGARVVTIYGIGRVCHIAFWEPHFAADFGSVDDWRMQNYRLGAKLHPLTIEQNAITSFKSRTTAVPAFANTIGPGLFLRSDRCIGGCDGSLGRGMMWQGMSLWVTLLYGPDPWVPSSWRPTLPGRLFFLSELAGPLIAEVN